MRAEGYRGLIIGVTGDADAADLAVFQAHGADTVLTKPVQVERLKEAVDAHFEKLGKV